MYNHTHNHNHIKVRCKINTKYILNIPQAITNDTALRLNKKPHRHPVSVSFY